MTSEPGRQFDASDDGTETAEARAVSPGEVPGGAVACSPYRSRRAVERAHAIPAYTVTTGRLPLKNRKGESAAHLFFTAYTSGDDNLPEEKWAGRPLLFAFSGGPGLASTLLHLGAIGPKRVEFTPEGQIPAPPYRIVDNPHTLLGCADLVFIDPIGTGFSRTTQPEGGQEYWGIQQDIEAIGEFIRAYLSQYHRWFSPLYLLGTSYGAARAAGLSDYLLGLGIGLSGIVLVSPGLDWLTGDPRRGHDLPHVLALPTYTATAWYHRRLPPDLLDDLHAATREAEAWASSAYVVALLKGDRLPVTERRQILRNLARYTGLDEDYLDRSDLRVKRDHFCKELLRRENRSISRLDSRSKTIDADALSEQADFDPLRLPTGPLLTAAINYYLRAVLGITVGAEYRLFNKEANDGWDWGGGGQGYPERSEALRNAMTKNPNMKVFVASGYFDLTTPYSDTVYTLAHMGLDAGLRVNIQTRMYETGHAIYLDESALPKFKADLAEFMESAPQRAQTKNLDRKPVYNEDH